ncbi:DNA mismatch repair protein MutL [Bacteroidia bacterium]|nr:DNA mismatch repair protein MutL [Bacteroidia bacterium]
MSNIIKLLPNSVINQIAAGQVVHRPASVVKEMMENAIDAGATDVKVNFCEGGLEMMTIVDNGRGMSPEDARLAFERHSTSKIGNVEDLCSLSTFGFRGEALASIASVAEVEVITREESGQLATRIAISGGKFVSQESVNAPAGTQFRVRNLFYNTPAQRRFLDKSSTEERHIMAEFKRVALCHPQVACSLYRNDALLMNLPVATLKGRVAAVAGRHLASTLLDLSTGTTIVEIEGFVTTPEAARLRGSEQYFFVNGRFFKSGYFHKAVMAAYDKLIPTGTQPAYFIFLRSDPSRIDVNIHPQKTDIKFDDQSAVWQIINASVRESLAKLGVVPMMDLDPRSAIEIPLASKRRAGGLPLTAPPHVANPDYNPFADHSPRLGSVADVAAPYVITRPQREEDGSILEYISGEEGSQTTIDMGQAPVFYDHMPLGDRYLVANLGGELALVDIARAWEAILYDKYSKMLSGSLSVSQGLLFPQEVVLSADDVQLLDSSREDFSSCGFELKLLDQNKVALHGIPADIDPGEITELIYDMLDAIRLQDGQVARVKNDALAAAVARHGATTRSRNYTKEELGAMLATLEGCSSPRFTPSGKKIVATLSHEQIKELLK